MRTKFFLLFLGLSGLLPCSFAQIKVRLLTVNKPLYVWFTPVAGSYSVMAADSVIAKIPEGRPSVIIYYKGKVAFRQEGKAGFSTDSLIIKSDIENGQFRLEWGKKNDLSRHYSGSLTCKPDMETLLLLNDTPVDDYIAGVVKAEGGNGNSTEFYKAQALIAYTYLVRHESRHSKDRYNVCDDVHCQAYKGLTSDKMINEAVRLTSGEVIVTPDSIPIISAFHSNCGGETSPASFAWVESVPYLIKVEDPWCVTTGNASWTKKIKREEWIAALAKGGFDKNATGTRFGFDQSTRLQFYKTGSTSIPFRDIRTSLGLRSAWFSVTDTGDDIVLNGKGYGHGVGLCQEGAMKMAREGYDYISIIKFYYRGVSTLRKEYVKKPALID